LHSLTHTVAFHFLSISISLSLLCIFL